MRLMMVAAAAAAMLAGCAGTPREMQALGALDAVQIAAGHQDAAECAVPKFDETSGTISALRVFRTHAEVYGSSLGFPLTFIDFRPNDGGTLASVYVSDNAMFRGMLGGKLATALEECATSLGQPPA